MRLRDHSGLCLAPLCVVTRGGTVRPSTFPVRGSKARSALGQMNVDSSKAYLVGLPVLNAARIGVGMRWAGKGREKWASVD